MAGRRAFTSLRAYVEHRLNTEPRLAQQDIAADLGLSPSALSLYLSGRRRPGATAALRIAKVAKVPLETLLQEVAP